MIAVIYLFKVKENQEDAFIEAWKSMTELLSAYCGGLGSRLHKQNKQEYIAYAQWPNQQSLEDAAKHLPEAATIIRDRMRATCVAVKSLYHLEVVEDLLKIAT